MEKYILPVTWTLAIFIVSSIPGSELPEQPFPGFDKFAHFVEYLILGFLWAKALGRKLFFIILLGIIYGILDEIHQIFVPLREFNIMDILVDSIGVVCGVICHLLLKK